MWFKWVLVGLWVIELCGSIQRVNKPEVHTAEETAANVLLNLLLIAGLLYFWR